MLRIASLNSLLIVIMLLWTACSDSKTSIPFYNSPEFDPLFIESEKEAEKMISHRIGDFSFTNQNGAQISNEDIEGKVHIASFIFTSCGSICPTMIDNLREAELRVNDDDLVILSYSVTPWIDSVSRLKKFTESKSIASPRWHFLTGKKGEIYELARRSYFAEEDIGFTKDSTDFLHTEHFILVDKKKRIRGIYNGTLSLDVGNMIDDARLLLAEGKNTDS